MPRGTQEKAELRFTPTFVYNQIVSSITALSCPWQVGVQCNQYGKEVEEEEDPPCPCVSAEGWAVDGSRVLPLK